ncbi:MAG: NUDIX domain-containing protein [Candidatus Izemoplasmataceae bacterium]
MKKVVEFGIKKDELIYIDREAVYGLLIVDGKIAIIKTPRGHFLPGGGVEQNESFKECLCREMTEETGYEVEVREYLGKSVLYDKSPKDNVYYNMFGNFYLVSITGVGKKIETDHEVVFLTPKTAIDYLKLAHQKWAIEKLLELKHLKE